jgi:hypothetical protein
MDQTVLGAFQQALLVTLPLNFHPQRMKTLITSLILLFSSNVWAQPAEGLSLPYQEEIQAMLNQIEYSGFEVLKNPEVTLDMDYEKGTWTLHNIHHYDAQGDILLDQGKYGLCAELSTYVYEKLEKVVDLQKYYLRLAMVTEPRFFTTTESNHIVVLINDKQTDVTYLIDPSYRIYRPLSDLSGYQIIGIEDALTFTKKKTRDVVLKVNQARPLFIRDDLLLSLSVTSVDDQYNKENFLFVVTANKKGKKEGANIMVVGRYKGEMQSYESRQFLEVFLSPSDMAILYQKLTTWLSQNDLKNFIFLLFVPSAMTK